MKALIYWDGQVEPGQIADWEKSVLNTVQSYIHAVTNYTGVRLLSQTEVDPNTRILSFEAIGAVTPSTSTDLTFRKTDKGWRQLIADQ